MFSMSCSIHLKQLWGSESSKKQQGTPHIKLFWNVTTAVLLMHILLVPCCHGISRLPIRQSKTVNFFSRISDERVGIVKREAPSSKALSNMENNLKGISGNGYYLDINIGTPPQTVRFASFSLSFPSNLRNFMLLSNKKGNYFLQQ